MKRKIFYSVFISILIIIGIFSAYIIFKNPFKPAYFGKWSYDQGIINGENHSINTIEFNEKNIILKNIFSSDTYKAVIITTINTTYTVTPEKDNIYIFKIDNIEGNVDIQGDFKNTVSSAEDIKKTALDTFKQYTMIKIKISDDKKELLYFKPDNLEFVKYIREN